MQTPQAFRYAILATALDRVTYDVTDDAALVEATGVLVQVFPGLTQNMKVTTVDDLELAAFWLARRSTAVPRP